MQRYQQVYALRKRGLLPGGFTYREYRSSFQEQMESRDLAAQSRSLALISFGALAKIEREWAGLRGQIDKARIIDGANIGPLESALRERIDEARRAKPSEMAGLVGQAEAAYNALKSEVERIIREQNEALQALTNMLEDKTLRAQRRKARDDATFDTTQLTRLTQVVQREKAAAFKAETATKQDVKEARDALLALDSRVTDDLEFLRMIEKAPGGMASLEDGSAFSKFRAEFREKATTAWAAFKAEAAKDARVKATCLAELTTVTDFLPRRPIWPGR